MRLTEHFTLEEFTDSQTATRLGIDNSIPKELMPNAIFLAMFMEQVRIILGTPIIVNSAYRCPSLNKSIGGAEHSAHMSALACDFIAPNFGSPIFICRKLADSGLKFDQLIYEGTWVHISPRGPNGEVRQQVMTAKFDTGKAVYSMGINE